MFIATRPGNAPCAKYRAPFNDIGCRGVAARKQTAMRYIWSPGWLDVPVPSLVNHESRRTGVAFFVDHGTKPALDRDGGHGEIGAVLSEDVPHGNQDPLVRGMGMRVRKFPDASEGS